MSYSKDNHSNFLKKGFITMTNNNMDNLSQIAGKSSYGEKLKKYIKSKDSMHRAANKKFSKEAKEKCPPGYIKRDGYKISSHKSNSKSGKKTSVKGAWVAPACIKSQTGKSVKGPKLITIMEKDVLSKYGYDKIKSLSPKERKTALKNAIRDIKPLSVYRRLVALSTLNKNKDVDLYKILKDDSEWIKTQVEYIIHKAANSKKSSKASKSSKTSSKKTSKKTSSKKSKTTSKKTSKKMQKGGLINDINMMKSQESNNNSISRTNSKLGSKNKNKLFYYKN